MCMPLGCPPSKRVSGTPPRRSSRRRSRCGRRSSARATSCRPGTTSPPRPPPACSTAAETRSTRGSPAGSRSTSSSPTCATSAVSRRSSSRPRRRRGLERRRPRDVGAGGHARSVQGALRRTGSRGARERRRARGARRMADRARALGDVELRRGCGGCDRARRGRVRARPAGRVLDRAARPRLGHEPRRLSRRRPRAAARRRAAPARPRGAPSPAGVRRRDRRGPQRVLEGDSPPARRVEPRGGGWLTVEDFAGFRAEVAPAVGRAYGGWRLHADTLVPGPRWCRLAILDGFDLPALGHNTAEYLHVLAEAVKLAFSDRER